jgi:hypothetical protein
MLDSMPLILPLLTLSIVTVQGPGDPLLAGLARPLAGRSRRATSSFRLGKDGKYDPKAPLTSDGFEHSNFDNFRVAPGETKVLMDEHGPGAITHLWMTFLGPEPQNWAPNGSANHQEMLLRIYWDGERKPSVEAPVGDFFANAFGERSEVLSLPVQVEDSDSYNCFWRMPFRKSARVEIVNQSDKSVNLLYYNIDWLQLDKVATETPYFHAQYRQEYPAKHGDYVILDTKGKGHYVGTVLSVRTRSPSWFGEGDEKVYIDGEATPSIWGTGTEDYFLSAWGLKKSSTPFYGVPYFDQWGIVGGHTSAYRWHLADPIVFQKGIKMTMEHMGWMSADENPQHQTNSWNEREDDYSSVAFWYQTGPSTFLARAPSASARKLPTLERSVVYATDAARVGGGKAEPQKLDFYDHPQLLFMPSTASGAFIEIPFTVAKKEPLRLLLNVTTSYDFGIYQVSLDGVRLGGPIDMYSKDVANTEAHLLDFWPEPGPHVLRLECLGKNASSAGFYAGIESLRLRQRRPRVTQFGWDKDKDWRKEPTLYN